jgi:spoIIIJ-associated protein
VEWVETTGKTLEDAKEAALDQLGVTEDETEFEVLAEPKQGLFGRTRGEARVRARIRPVQPRPKVERRDRKRRGGKAENGRSPKGAKPTSGNGTTTELTEPTGAAARAEGRPTRDTAPSATGDAPDRSTSGSSRRRSDTTKGAPVSESDQNVDLEAHTAIVTEFVIGLVDAFGYDASVEADALDDENVEVRVDGQDLGLLVGPKGATLAAVQELSRTVVHRKVPGTAEGRVRVDVAGYRQRRREALERFVVQVAEQVRESGVAKALEPMGPPDRKVVHDTVNEIEGVGTISEGEEPRRRVVVVPS